MKVTRVSASLYFFPLVLFVVTSIYTFIDPNFEGGAINIAFRYGGFIPCLLLFLFGSLLWFNQDLSLKLRFLFKLDEFDKNSISDIYIIMDRILVFAFLFICRIIQYAVC